MQRDAEVTHALDWLRAHSAPETREAMTVRYGIPSHHAFGVSMADMKRLGRELGHDHELADALWTTGVYEARIVASLVDEADRVTSSQMDRWCRDFDSWAICDTVCFNLFDRARPAWRKVDTWAGRPEEYVKRGAFALLWSLALHDASADDRLFVEALDLVEREAVDDRPMVTKSISMAIYAVGVRNPTLTVAATASAQRLAESSSIPARRVGRGALRRLARADVAGNGATPPGGGPV